MGRPSKLTVERGSRILAACALGMPPGFAAECAGIDRSTWKRWRHRYVFFRARCEALYHTAREAEPGTSSWIAALEAASGEPLVRSRTISVVEPVRPKVGWQVTKPSRSMDGIWGAKFRDRTAVA